MSLLNEMLRDLVKQQKVVAAPVVCSQDILQDTTLLKRSAFNWVPSTVIFVVVFSSVLAFKYFFSSIQLSRHLPAPVANTNIPAKEVLPSSQVTPLPGAASNANSAIDALPDNSLQSTERKYANTSVDVAVSQNNVGANSNDEQLQRDIADLLLQANRALTQDKLTSPIDDNAYSYFQTIARLSPNHPQVKIGLELIAARYLEKARQELNIGNYQLADIDRQRANFVAPEYFTENDFTATEKLMLQNALGRTGKSSDIQSIPSSAYQATAQSTVQSTALPLKPQSETIKPFVVAEASVSSLNVVPNAGWKDEQLAAHANDLIRQGKTADALQLLKNFVVSESKPIRSVALLGDLYSQQGNADALNILARNSTFLPAVDKSKLHAQLLAAQGDELAAIAELEHQLTAAGDNEQYYAFLASLYHKMGQYEQSVVIYQRMLNSFGEKPAYLLGLALAFDGLMQHKNALQAYQRLLPFPQLQEQVKNYINQRIAALSNE